VSAADAPLLLGIDVGTSSVKAVLATAEGEVVARAAHDHDVSMPRPGWVEQDPDADWWAGAIAVCRRLLPARAPIAAVCVSGMGPCMAACDALGTPLRPAMLYGVDTRATREIAELEERYGRAAIAARCGSRLTTQAVGPKLLWLRRNEPGIYARTRRFATASSFVLQRLTGEYAIDHHTASQCAPLYDLRAHRWIEEWAEQIAPGVELPPLRWPSEPVGTVTSAASALTGIPTGTPVSAGTVDAWAEAVSVGVLAPGELMLMYGTTMFLVAMVDGPRADDRLWCTTGCFPGSWSLAGGMATSGALTAWLRDLAGAPSWERLAQEAAATPPGADGLVVLPYFLGERTPLFDPDARGLVAGLTLRHGRGHLYRALLEATAYAVRHHLEVLREAGAAPARVVAVGGGAASGLWPQVVADVGGLAQELPRETIGAAYGSAFLAAVGAGLAGADVPWARPARVVEPDPATAAVYDELYGVYRDLYPATRTASHALARLQEVTMDGR
jgi:xylulokinase